ncbi:MAG: hypothetical protein ACYC1I_11160 [Acidimicrobiales bacterium]|jgi:hypothetical protein
MSAFFGSINLAGSWGTAWTAISGRVGAFSSLSVAIGASVVVVGLVGYIRERRRGGGNHSKLIYTIVIGAVIGVPGVVIPVLLTGVDFIANALLGLLHTASSG